MDRRNAPLVSRPVWFLAGITLLVHLATAENYGIFRDELYYLACADHLAWGYVDHPPLSVAFLALFRSVFGDSLLALRLVPALLHAGVVLGTGRLANQMGAEGFGATLAALCVLVAPGFLGLTSFYSMNALDLAFYLAAMLAYAQILAQGGKRPWIILGLIVGLGLLNKYSMAFLAAGFGIGLLLSSRRRELLAPGRWIGLAIAVLLFAPHLAWQIAHGWPTREFIANAQQYKMSALAPGEFLFQVFLEMQPPSILVWGAGLLALLFAPRLRPMRPFGIAWLVVLAILLVERSKPYYLDATFPMLFAAGGVVWERVARQRGWGWTRWAQVACLSVSGIVISPYAIPVLPPETYIAYNKILKINPESGENHEMGPLPQHFADRFGWREMAEAIAAVYDGLSPEDQASCLIVARNYGQAGAIDYFGPELGLPPAVSQHNSFYLWGPGGDDFAVVISIGQSREDLLTAFEQVEEAGRFDHPYAMPYERRSPIYVCRGWRMSVAEAWRLGRMYI